MKRVQADQPGCFLDRPLGRRVCGFHPQGVVCLGGARIRKRPGDGDCLPRQPHPTQSPRQGATEGLFRTSPWRLEGMGAWIPGVSTPGWNRTPFGLGECRGGHEPRRGLHPAGRGGNARQRAPKRRRPAHNPGQSPDPPLPSVRRHLSGVAAGGALKSRQSAGSANPPTSGVRAGGRVVGGFARLTGCQDESRRLLFPGNCPTEGLLVHWTRSPRDPERCITLFGMLSPESRNPESGHLTSGHVPGGWYTY